MRKNAYRSAITAAFLGSVAVATAAELNLTAQQKQTILQSVQTERGQPAPAGFLPRVGAPVPQSMSMRRLPSNVTTQVPLTKDLEYTILDNNEVLLIDPKDRRVAEIITPSGTTGAAPTRYRPPQAPRDKASIGNPDAVGDRRIRREDHPCHPEIELSVVVVLVGNAALSLSRDRGPQRCDATVLGRERLRRRFAST